MTVVAQDRHTGTIRMLAHANAEAIEATLRTGVATFYSRSRQALWVKGETSGNAMKVCEVFADCDGDALVYLVDPVGPSCHTGARACFYRPVRLDGGTTVVAPANETNDQGVPHARPTLSLLEATLAARARGEGERSYTRSLLDKGATKITEKLVEEAGELGQALQGESDERVVSEAADVIYHLMVGLLSRGVARRDVEAELARRFGTSGIDEKASRS